MHSKDYWLISSLTAIDFSGIGNAVAGSTVKHGFGPTRRGSPRSLAKRPLSAARKNGAEWPPNNAARPACGSASRPKTASPSAMSEMTGLVPHYRLAMFGAMIGEPEYWGGGYGTDALLLIVDYAFRLARYA